MTWRMRCVVVSHTHWDREWYRTFQAFRARLVDTVDRVLELVDSDPGFRFLLDGQTIVLEDYLEVRPERRAALERACRAGRIAIGPWYVQPDSLLPSGEAHVRNLLEGRRVGRSIGPVSTVAYTPDSFGHPAQLPQLFAGFGLELFVYWRGNGNEIDDLPAEYRWQAPDGSEIAAHHLGEGYFNACGLPTDADAAAAFLAEVADRLAPRTRTGTVLLMNGIDHALPDANIGAAAEALARRAGWTVQRGLLEDFARELPPEAPRFRGELVGGRVANLLPGVWSARTPLKLRNRRAEALLEGWAEPWSALGRCHGTADERPSLRLAWRALLQNQAHDSICGCSQDQVHEQMKFRYDTAEELAEQTTQRVLERLAGLGTARRSPRTDGVDLAVFNPSPHPRTDVVRFSLEPSHWMEFGGTTSRSLSLHPWLLTGVTVDGYTVDGTPARLVPDGAGRRVQLSPERPPYSLEFVAADVPAYGWRRVRLQPSDAHPEVEDEGREIACGDLAVCAADDGTFELRHGTAVFRGLCAVEDAGDRGDTYDFDRLEGSLALPSAVVVRRRRHASGIQSLSVRRTLVVPVGLAADRSRRAEARVPLQLETEARLAPGVARVDLLVRLGNTARDHRLRLLFPTGRPARAFEAATTFDIARRSTAPPEAAGWVHPAPTTFVQQGFVHANGLTVAAAGLPEAEVTPDGVIAVTIVRAVGWLALMDLTTRPQPAGPVVATPGAQCQEDIEARLALFAGLNPRAARDAEVSLRAVAAGAEPLLPPGHALLRVEPGAVLVTALKPAVDGDGVVLRLLNPTAAPLDATVHAGFAFAGADPIRLDEERDDWPLRVEGATITLPVPAHALRSLRLRCGET